MDQGEDGRDGRLAAMLLAPVAGAQDKIVWDIAIYGPPREVTAPIEYLAKYVDEKIGAANSPSSFTTAN